MVMHGAAEWWNKSGMIVPEQTEVRKGDAGKTCNGHDEGVADEDRKPGAWNQAVLSERIFMWVSGAGHGDGR